MFAATLACGVYASDEAERLLKSGRNAEVVDGDLRSAIEKYKKAAQVGNRAQVAQALLRQAECHQKLGDADAKKIYGRVMREFADQKEAASTARARLGVTVGAETALTIRQVWSGQDVNLDGSPSPDGRYLAYVNWKARGNLAIRDLTTGENRDLTTETDWSFAERPVITPDGKRVVYSWYSNPTAQWTLRSIALDGSAMRTISDAELVPASISPDGKTIAGTLFDKGTRQLAVADAATGKVTVLKSLKWMRPDIGNFSPDGKFLAYALPVTADSEDRNVYVISVDGSSESTVAAAPGSSSRPFFTPDGSQLVHASNKTSRWDLWAVPMYVGKPSGAAEVLRPDIGKVRLLGFDKNGGLYVGAEVQEMEVRVVDLDPSSWTVKGEPRRIASRYHSINTAANWSRDGSKLAYISNRKNLENGQSGEVTFVVRTVADGKEREYTVPVAQFATARAFQWFPDGQSLLLTEYWQGGGGFRRLDLTTGAVSPLFKPVPGSTGFFGTVSPDGKGVLYGVKDTTTLDPKDPNKPPVTRLARRDLVSGEETYIASPKAWVLTSPVTSHDGKYVAFHAFCAGEKEQCIWVVPVSGGEAPRVLRVTKGRLLQGWGMAFAPKNEGLFATVTESQAGKLEHSEIVFVPMNGGASRTVGIPMPLVTMPSVHPSGTSLAFSETKNDGHVSVVQNLFRKESRRAAK
jgi:Tol biopolymer transport system component